MPNTEVWKKRSFLSFCLLVVSLASSNALGADVVLQLKAFRGTMENPQGSENRLEIVFAEDRVFARDLGWPSILRLDRQELIIIEHPEQAYSRIPIPARFEDYIEPAAREFNARWGHSFPGPQTASVERTGESRHFGDWRAERVEIDVRDENGDKAEHWTLWLSTEIGVDLRPVEELIRHRAYVSESGRRHWVDQLVDLEGFPVVQQITRFTKRGEFTHTIRLAAVSERDVDDSVYEPPAGYEEVRFRSVRFAVPQPLP